MKTIKIVLLVILSTAVFSCGGKEEKKKEGFSYEKTTEVSKEVESNPNDVVITSNDAMQFNKKEIKVEAGKKVKITLRHIGKMDKNVMGHNFVLLKKGVNLVAFGNKAAIILLMMYKKSVWVYPKRFFTFNPRCILI